MNNNKYLLFDGRYYDDPFKAIVYCTEATQREAIKTKVEEFEDAVIVFSPDEGKVGEIDLEAMAIADGILGN